MRKYIDLFSWGFMAIFAAPTLLIMGSWSSLPGDVIYPVKLGLEKVLLFVVKPSYAAEASLNLKYSDRRLADAKILLANDQSGKGLSYLSQQIIATREVIDRAPNPTVKRQLAQQYVATLKTASLELAQQKQTIVRQQAFAQQAGGQNKINPTLPPYVPPTSQPIAGQQNVPVATPTVIPVDNTGNGSTVGGQIDNTQQTINDTIGQLEQAAANADVIAPTPTLMPTETPLPAPTATPEPVPSATPIPPSPTSHQNQNNNDGGNNNGNGNGNGGH